MCLSGLAQSLGLPPRNKDLVMMSECGVGVGVGFGVGVGVGVGAVAIVGKVCRRHLRFCTKTSSRD